MDVFKYRNELIDDYRSYVTSFININDSKIKSHVESEFKQGVLWKDPLVQLNPPKSPNHPSNPLPPPKECFQVICIRPALCSERWDCPRYRPAWAGIEG